MKIKTTKGEFVNLVNNLFTLKDLEGKLFAVAVARNIATLTDNLKDLEEKGRPSKEFMDLALSVNAYTDKKDDEEAIYKIEELEKDNKELIDERRKQLDDVSVLMQGEIEIELQPITFDMLPEDITAAQITGIQKLME